MNQQSALMVMIVVAVAIVALMAWGWHRRARRDAQPLSPVAELPEGSRVNATFAGLYIGTTREGQPLQRLASPGLGLRSHVDITVADTGLALDIPGQSRIVIPAAALTDVGQTTTALDSVVERDGLTRVTWRTGPGFIADSYFRPQDASAHALADSIRPLINPASTDITPTPTGTAS